jgi:UDP-3-O-[3-hydroxymyristoyl] N-acetylglucosamine deacetylase
MINHGLWLFCHARKPSWPRKLMNSKTLTSSPLTHEQTIRGPVACAGIGLHSGAPVNLRILPAPAGTGIVFRRTDLDDFEIEASGRNVARVSYATSLMKKGVLISTTEHLLSAFIGAGIDNAIVELDNLELPILDGSARPFVEMIEKAGIRRQRKTRTYLRVVREVELREGDKFIAVYPANTYSVSYSINFPHPQIGRQTFCVQLTNGSYVREIAPARTFGFLHEADAMRQQGLIRGASTENAIVLNRETVLNPPLRFVDEFVRHKVLDLIGDLALIGKQILGSVVADRAGHAMHTALVSRLLRDKSYWEETSLEDTTSERPATSEVHLSI